ncbi:hypothetical protein ES705_10773 [subsurface metagenome]
MGALRRFPRVYQSFPTYILPGDLHGNAPFGLFRDRIFVVLLVVKGACIFRTKPLRGNLEQDMEVTSTRSVITILRSVCSLDWMRMRFESIAAMMKFSPKNPAKTSPLLTVHAFPYPLLHTTSLPCPLFFLDLPYPTTV